MRRKGRGKKTKNDGEGGKWWKKEEDKGLTETKEG
jgi:hypothetical protein